MRQILLDTETTGIGAESGHRIIEIGCVELIDRQLTGNHFHVYLNPERDIDEGAFKVHGISRDFLEDKPKFTDIIDDFINFIKSSELIIHNAPFDVGFLDVELRRANFNRKIKDICDIFDTLEYARKKYPGQRNNLDALCKRFDIKHFNRDLHGALLDSEILAHVYLAMTGGQASLVFDDEINTPKKLKQKTSSQKKLKSDTPIILASTEELAMHNEFVKFISEKSGKNHWK